jgi:hypothetical protein
MVLSIRYSTIKKRMRPVLNIKCTLKQNFCSNLDLDTFSNNIVGTSFHLKGSLFQINPKTANDVVNCSSEMVLSIRYSTIKKKEAARIEYPAIRTTSFVSIVVYLQREQ